jgi:hypothetical protein
MPKRLVVLILLLVIIFYASFKPVNASISSCVVNSYNPQNLTSGENATIVFNVTNNDESSNLLHWLKVSAPSNFVITSLDGPSSGGTIINDSGSEAVIMTTLSPGESGDFSVGVTTTGGVTSSGSFGIQASDSSDGTSPVNCGGDTTVALASGGSSAISISNISLSVSDSKAIISWSSSIPTTGSVQYGATSGYGATVIDSSLGTTHSATVSGLSSSTTYHYLISSTDQSGNTASLTDKTFVTSPSGETKTITTTVTSSTTNIVREVFRDVTLPSIKIKTELKKIYESFPEIVFLASDDSGIARIRYSLDSGVNWLPVNIEDQIGKKQITSILSPKISDDGEYSIIIEVTDAAGNKNVSKESKITIDRLPPSVGPLIVMAGPQIINIGNTDIMDLLVGVDYKLILTASGGPSSVKLVCSDKNYGFQKNIDSGVWTTKIKFDGNIESCTPKIVAVDGANNVQEKIGKKIIINKRGSFKNGTITVYWYDSSENKFVLWDAEPYGQVNPISTSETGGYALLLPSGKYYIEGKSAGKRTTVSNIINLESTAIVNEDWTLKSAWKFWQISEEKIINPKLLGNGEWNSTKFSLPKVNLERADSEPFSTLDIRGKTSVVGLITSWHPLLNSYLNVLDDLNRDGIDSYPVLMQEKKSSATYLKKRGHYDLDIFTDPDGKLLEGIEVNGLPTTLIVDRFGQIQNIKVGSISEEEIKVLY